MKAVYVRSQGPPDVLEYGDLPDPLPAEGEALVRVRAIGVNRLDLYTRAGARGMRLPDDAFPWVLGGDCAGTVAALGDGAAGVTLGDRVAVNPCLSTQPVPRMLGSAAQGSYAELVSVPAQNLVPIPDSLSFEQAASLPTVFLPAWNIIVEIGHLQASETALVLSASSGVGTAAVQVVKRIVGARCIAATGSPEKARAALDLGADAAIDYEQEDLGVRLRDLAPRGVDLVVDPSGARFFADAFGALGRNGRYGICGVTSGYEAGIHLGQLFAKQLRVFGVFMGKTGQLAEIVRAAADGHVRGVIHRSLPLEEARAAHEEMERGQHFGKFVLTVPG